MLGDRKKQIELSFADLAEKKKELLSQINIIDLEQLRLQGAYREIETLLKQESEKPKLEIVN